jgi:sulfur carrier protein ThiS
MAHFGSSGEHRMLTYEDCLALVELTPEQVAVIADRQHVPEMIALELGSHLCGTTQGELRIKRMIVEAIEAARARGDTPRAAQLRLVLRQFIESHPRAH